MQTRACPHCGGEIEVYRNPAPTVDIVIFDPARGVVLIERANEPHGYALPGGFVDYGETVQQAAVREAKEETGLSVILTGLLGVYSDPKRDERKHTLSIVFTAQAENPEQLQAGDDAAGAAFYPLGQWPDPLAFDHAQVLTDFMAGLPGLGVYG